MTRVLVFGAHGQIARVAIDLFLDETDAELTLYLRNAERLGHLLGNDRVRLIEGDAVDRVAVEAAMEGQDVVYANLSGRMGEQARVIVASMEQQGLKRLIYISSELFSVGFSWGKAFYRVGRWRRKQEVPDESRT